MAEIPEELLPGTAYTVECSRHRHTVGFISRAVRGGSEIRAFNSFAPCGRCPCPAGGEHEWGVLEEAGTGKEWAGCENCGASAPKGER